MLRWVWLALTFACAAALAAAPDLPKLRHLSEAQPAAALVEGRQLLDSGELGDDPTSAREVLRWMGRAALIQADDAALAEVVLRLDGLAQTHSDPIAKAYAGFLRADQLQAQGKGRDALAEALSAADSLQDKRDPELLALSDYSLCTAYDEIQEFERALPFCQHARERWHATGNAYDEGRALSLEADVRYNQNDSATAIRLLEQARALYRKLGEDSMALSASDNLARLYIGKGRASEALELSRSAYAQDRASDRELYAVLSRANIARALSALGRHQEAQAEIGGAVSEAREHKLVSTLPDLLDGQSRIAEAAGDLKLALKSLRESADLDQNAPKHSDSANSVAALEARFASREKELQIRELERANHIKQLELTAANAQAVQHEEELSRQRLSLIAASVAVVALIVITVLLFKLLRVQRRHGALLSEQALRDPLTGVDNRRALFLHMRQLLAEQGPPLPHALLLLDLDHFKQVNDNHGHPAGDAVLIAVARQLAQRLGERGSLARLGGEEFAILCPGCGRNVAIELADDLRHAVAELLVADVPALGQVTASIGVALFDGEGSLDDWMRAVDRALYAAKARGRNCVVEASSVRVDVA
jgi:diguanylate cyclase (GGDEF)-like protein